MNDSPISDALIDYLLLSIDGHRFEAFIQALLGIRDGEQFVALGGVHDGGADGFLRSTYENKTGAGHFIQMSVQDNVSDKVRKTIQRLQEVGRNVDTLTYWSPNRLPQLDILEVKLSKDLGITIRIRDRHAVLRLVNHDVKTREHFQATFRAEIYELSAQAKNLDKQQPDFATDPSVFVFLQFETADRFSKGGLVVPVVDALIYWSLRDTDPDQQKLLSRSEIKKRITELLPGAATTLVPVVDDRLMALVSKDGGGTQRIRGYANSDSFCLPYAMRVELATTGAAERVLLSEVQQSLRERAAQAGAADPNLVAEVCERAMYKHFTEQGLLLAAFLEKRLEEITISDQVVELELQACASGKVHDTKSYSAALTVLRQVFYTPNSKEADFLRRLCRTSLLLFSLKHCPKLIEYFNQMSGHFRLLVGADMLIKAISESFLPAEHRHVTNLLKVAQACGAQLVLTQPVGLEIFTHLHAAHLEFRNHYAEQEPYITPSLAAQSDRILIRTYFYARLLMKQVAGWKAFINRFLDLDELTSKSEKGQAQLQAYLCKTFKLEFMSESDAKADVDKNEVDDLAEKLARRNVGKNIALAKNDALMVLSVYAQRRTNKETEKYDGFGLRTWWLTKEFHVLNYTAQIVAKHGGTPYIMRPEFLLNYLTLSPKANEADSATRQLLPSHVGLQIGQHLPEQHMRRILAEFDHWKELSPERVEVKLSDAVDRLKFDRLKRYGSNIDFTGQSEADQLIATLRTVR